MGVVIYPLSFLSALAALGYEVVSARFFYSFFNRSESGIRIAVLAVVAMIVPTTLMRDPLNVEKICFYEMRDHRGMDFVS